MVRALAKDRLFWLIASVVVALVAVAPVLKPSGPGVEGSGPLLGRQAAPVDAAEATEPLLYAVQNGAFPSVDPAMTLGKAFARYRWFAGEPKWLVRGGASSRIVGVVAALEVPPAQARLGIGSDAAAVFYVAEFAVSPDGASFRPTLSAVEVRDASNKLTGRLLDQDFSMLRRVVRGLEPVLPFGAQQGKPQ